MQCLNVRCEISMHVAHMLMVGAHKSFIMKSVTRLKYRCGWIGGNHGDNDANKRSIFVHLCWRLTEGIMCDLFNDL